MINYPHSTTHQGLTPANSLTLVQHNTLGSWNVFLSLFSSLKEGPATDIVLLEDPPPTKAFLPGFSGFKSFSPHNPTPKIPCYVSQRLLQYFSVLRLFCADSEDFMALDVYTPKGGFGSSFSRCRIGNLYARPINPTFTTKKLTAQRNRVRVLV